MWHPEFLDKLVLLSDSKEKPAITPGSGKHFNRWPKSRYWWNSVFAESLPGIRTRAVLVRATDHVLPKAFCRVGPAGFIPKGITIQPPTAGWLKPYPSAHSPEWICDQGILRRKRQLTPYWDPLHYLPLQFISIISYRVEYKAEDQSHNHIKTLQGVFHSAINTLLGWLKSHREHKLMAS